MMKPFSPATLFVEPPPPGGRSPAFAASLLLHFAIISGVTLGFSAPRQGSTERTVPRYTVRFLKLRAPEARRKLAGAQAPAPRGSSTVTAKASSESPAPGPSNTPRRFELPVPAHIEPAKQTLVQLDAPPKITLKQIAVPDVLLWAQKEVPAPRKQLVPPPPSQVPKPAQSLLAPPSFDLPNQEIKVADLRFSQPPSASIPKLPAPPATTSPVRVRGPEEGTQIPQTVSTNSSQESDAHLISVSSLPLRADSVVVVLPTTEFAPSGSHGTEGSGNGPGTGKAAGAKTAESGAVNAKQTGAGTGGTVESASAAGNGAEKLAGSGNAAEGSGSRAVGQPSDETITGPVHRITLSRDGHFSVVVVGSSASEAYPDSVGLLTGKVVYTVYLKVGLRKSWILQYCLPGIVEQKLVVKGSATPLEAPFPFLMLRPDAAMSSDADSIMVHGLVNTEGRFEHLALVLPGALPQKEGLLASLQKWEFRPAKRDQQPIAVEVLLIIPGEGE